MYIGDTVKKRMDLFGYSLDLLIEKTPFTFSFLNDIISNKIHVKDIDSFDLEVLANALLCTPDYFTSNRVRENDVVFASLNRGENTKSSNFTKAKIQRYMKDLIFVKETLM